MTGLRPSDLARSQTVWVYRPAEHKTQHLGRERLIFIGPRVQEIIRPYLDRAVEAYCFSPADSERERRRAMRELCRSKVQPSQQDRAKQRPRVKPGERYRKDAYSRTVQRACDKAFPPPANLSDEEAAAWLKAQRWSPNRLRHTAATEIRQRYGLEAAQVVLGHSRADVTQMYAERDRGLAARIMGEIG